MEITEHHFQVHCQAHQIGRERQDTNQIANDELRRCHGWKEYTREEVQPRWGVVWFYYITIVAIFNYYISAAKGDSIRERFVEMQGSA